MDLRNGVLPPGKDILKYCFKPSKLGENRGRQNYKSNKQVLVNGLISWKLCKL